MFRITSQLKLCGENITENDMLEKTFSTFHASNLLLQQQYREKGFKEYSGLISCLLLAEKNNELLMKNHESRPTGSTPYLEINFTESSGRGRGRGRMGPRGRGRGRGRGCGHRYYGRERNNVYIRPEPHGQKKGQYDVQKNCPDKGKRKIEEKCYRCGMEGHWSQVCRTASHLVKLYQESLKEKGKQVETNLVEKIVADDNTDVVNATDDVLMPTLDVADFFTDNV